MNDQQNLLTPNNNYNQQSNLSNATASLVLGIISIVTSLCYVSALIGIICGVLGLVLGKEDNPHQSFIPAQVTANPMPEEPAVS